MKKKYLFIIFSFITISSVFSQLEKKYYLGAHLSYGKANYSKSSYQSYNSQKYNGKNYLSFTVDYSHRTSESTDFCIGISATLYRLDLSSTTTNISGGGSRTAIYDDFFGAFSIPVSLKYHCGKYFYINAGPVFNYHPYHGYTWGLGGFGGVGAEYSFKSGLTLSIAPQVQYNALGLGNTGSVSSGFDEKIIQLGVNVGVGYRF